MQQIQGWYSNTLLASLSTGGATELTWLESNKINPDGFDYHTFYDNGAVLAHKNFPAFAKAAYLKKMLCGIPWSKDVEVNQAITYNKSRVDNREKLTHLVSELEDYGNGNCTPAEFKSLLENNYMKAHGAGLKFGVYNGWTKQWNVVVKNSDFLLLHCYIPSADMSSAAKLFNYVQERLGFIAAEAKKLGKIYPVSIIFSVEPAFGKAYYTLSKWITPFNNLMTEYNKRATATMKNYLIMSGTYMFVTGFGKVVKPTGRIVINAKRKRKAKLIADAKPKRKYTKRNVAKKSKSSRSSVSSRSPKAIVQRRYPRLNTRKKR